jgi:hypothetical protein
MIIGRYDVEEHAAKLWPGKMVKWVCHGTIDGVDYWVIQLVGEPKTRVIYAATGVELGKEEAA